MKLSSFECNDVEDIFSVSKKKQFNHAMPESHFHSSYELYYLLEGERQFFIKDRTIVMGTGDLVIIRPNVLHRTANTEHPKHEKIILNFKEEFLAAFNGNFINTLHPNFQNDYLVIHFSLQHKILVEDMLQQIVLEAQEKKSSYEIYIQSLILQLLIFSSRYMEEHNIKPFEYLNTKHERISEVVRYINTYYKNDLSLQFLSNRFYVSPYYLSRTFKEVTGFTFVEYLNSVRIKEAKKLLEESNLKVSLIAAKVGFGSITHFGRVFKELTGHKPLFYRKRV
ncbi:helix-turn-helix domain-containing protein [Anaerocolumna sedimenticola]|uniref:Helix-turn-helix domain-containing protein n=1 Tax=Anaerocolumna sedimenticola TaxID=2696063 RepID=A0A6P1TU92_9FIRM|nr:AraC family transcriptional regulator [Anaerocolumna sedimenticola]QHQ63256.1 helix-turn-helix domain-containing protein [Anaerocolumna sedimenticola]